MLGRNLVGGGSSAHGFQGDPDITLYLGYEDPVKEAPEGMVGFPIGEDALGRVRFGSEVRVAY